MACTIIDPATAYKKYGWRIRKWLPERRGQACRIVRSGARGQLLIEFDDGWLVLTRITMIRRRKALDSSGKRERSEA